VALLPGIHGSRDLVQLLALEAKESKGFFSNVHVVVNIPQGVVVPTIIVVND
jgi:hypothetical protein